MRIFFYNGNFGGTKVLVKEVLILMKFIIYSGVSVFAVGTVLFELCVVNVMITS